MVGHVFIIVQVFCCFGKGEEAIAFRIRWSRRVADINTHYPWIPAFAGMTDRNPANHLNWNAIQGAQRSVIADAFGVYWQRLG